MSAALLPFAALDSVDVSAYSRDELLLARAYLLYVKRTARLGGFGELCGRMVRDVVGYKFDGMTIDDLLATMDTPDFLTRYAAALERWYASLNKSATEGTLKRNAGLHKAASALAVDEAAFRRLVKSLRIVCVRNQEWRERGANTDLTMNGHRAVLHFLCVNVTNARRLALSAS